MRIKIKYLFTAVNIILILKSSNDLVAQSNLWDVPKGFVVEKVVSDLFLPVNITFVPNPQADADAPIYYITELYGRVKVVLRNGEVGVYADSLLNFSPTGNFPGSGEMGVSGIVVEPNTGDLFVTMVYDDNGIKNKVVRMGSSDGGRTVNTIETLLDGIPGPPQSHQIHAATIGPDGKLYVQVGDGFNSASAQDDNDLRGKILRLNFDGSIPADNPDPTSYVYAKGLRNPFGGAWREADGLLYVSDNGPNRDDRLVKVEAGGNLGWPNSLTAAALKLWNPPVAPTAVSFCNGSGFPEDLRGRLFVGLSGPTFHPGQTQSGKRIEMFTLGEDGSVSAEAVFLNYIGGGRATVVGLTFGPDGLYFTDLYGEDGFDSNGITHANVYRVYYDPNTSVEDNKSSAPKQFALAQNYPNPFNPTTVISYELAGGSDVEITIYNQKGQAVKTLVSGQHQAGSYRIRWDGRNDEGKRVAGGLYLLRMKAGSFSSALKMLLIR